MREDIIQKAGEIYSPAYFKGLKFSMAAEGKYSYVIGDKGLMTYCGVARAFNGSWKGWSLIDIILEDFPDLKVAYEKAPKSIIDLNKRLEQNTELQLLLLEFYYNNYFKKCGASSVETLSSDLAIILFDISILQGVTRSVKTLQRVLNRVYKDNIVVDGVFGTGTLTALNKAISNYSEKALVESMFIEFIDNLNEAAKIGNNIKFKEGWNNRVLNLRNYCRIN